MNDAYWNRGKDALAANYAAIMSYVDRLEGNRRLDLKRLFEGALGEQFFTAPASSRREFHCAFPAGLVFHTVGVVENALKAAFAFSYTDQEKVIFAALLHDIGKAGRVGQPYYIEVKQQWRRERGEYFEVEQRDWMPTSEKGLFVLQEHGISLQHDEYMAIRLNDGAGPAENKPYAFRTPPLSYLIHQADLWAMLQEKEAESLL